MRIEEVEVVWKTQRREREREKENYVVKATITSSAIVVVIVIVIIVVAVPRGSEDRQAYTSTDGRILCGSSTILRCR